MLSIEKPLIIGKYSNGGGEMAWAWWMESHSRLAVIGSDELSPRKALVKSIAQNITSRDPKSVFWISTETPFGEISTDDSIEWVEKIPDPMDFEDSETFIGNRQFFSTAYFNLLARSIGINRSDLMPPSSYRTHIEGPMIGYKRTIESLADDHPYKKLLKGHLNDLADAKWHNTKEGNKIHIIESDNLYEKAMSLLAATWSFWAKTCKVDDQQQMLLVIELPKELLAVGLEKEIEDVVHRVLRVLTYISEVTTTTLILSSEMLHPIPSEELNLDYRFKLLFKTKDSDFDFESEGNKEAIDPLLYKQWEAGCSNAGYWMDDYTMERIVIEIFEKEIEFWDDFDEI